jgi:hypothetical protein
MIPRWQMVGCVVLALLCVALEITLDQDSYAHAFLWGECDKDPGLKACHPVGRAFGGSGALPHAP